MNISPEVQAINKLVELFDEVTGYRHDKWSLVEILAWFDDLDGATQGKDNDK